MNDKKQNKIRILKNFLERDMMTDSLELFSLYISSNPDFKYNITYLTDQIESFKRSCFELNNRFYQFENLIIVIRSITPKGIRGYLIFDEIFKYGVNTDEDDYLELINLDSFRFDKIDKNNHIVKFILGDKNNPEKFETYKVDQKKDPDISSKIKEHWATFIK